MSPHDTAEAPGPDEAAARALAKVAEEGVGDPAGEKLVRLLMKRQSVQARFDGVDLIPRIAAAGSRVAADGVAPAVALADLVESLERAPKTLLLAAFSAPTVGQTFHIGPVTFGPLKALVSDERLGEVPAHGDGFLRGIFGVLVEEDCVGIRGARRALQMMRRALGGLYLAGRAAGADTRIGPLPTDDLDPAVFVGPPGQLEGLVSRMRIPESVPIDVDGLLGDGEPRSLVEDCVQSPRDFVAERLSAAAAWTQVGFDALVYADAVLALGIALEALIGGDKGGDVVSIVSRRTAFLLRTGDGEERALTAYDWSERTKKLYGERSNVAHGRYAEGDTDKEAALRAEFEDLVCRVALQFRAIGRQEAWADEKAVRAWQQRLELG